VKRCISAWSPWSTRSECGRHSSGAKPQAPLRKCGIDLAWDVVEIHGSTFGSLIFLMNWHVTSLHYQMAHCNRTTPLAPIRKWKLLVSGRRLQAVAELCFPLQAKEPILFQEPAIRKLKAG
jgi:hypothetical protein